MEGVIDLWSALLVPDTLDSLQLHHYAVSICKQHPHSDTNEEIAAQWCQRGIYRKRFEQETCKINLIKSQLFTLCIQIIKHQC